MPPSECSRKSGTVGDCDIPACPLQKNDAVIDIGANQGFFSRNAASKGARVHAFEPFSESYRRLHSNVERNDFSSLVTTLQVGVSAAADKATMNCSNYLGGGGQHGCPSSRACHEERACGRLPAND